MNSARKFRTDKIRTIAATPGIILDMGGGARFTKWMKEYESLFAGKDYRTMDYDSSTNPDVIGDIHAIPLPDASIDAIICSSVLEHVIDPGRAVKEMHRILKPGGKLYLYVPSIYPYHARKGHYPDYWRFFDDTLTTLFGDWALLELEKVGGLFTALAFFMPFQSRLMPVLSPVAGFLDRITGAHKKATTSGYMAYVIR